MKLTHTLEPAPWTSKKAERENAGKLRYVHSWYDDTDGPHKGDRLGYQALLFNSAEHADRWIKAQQDAEVKS